MVLLPTNPDTLKPISRETAVSPAVSESKEIGSGIDQAGTAELRKFSLLLEKYLADKDSSRNISRDGAGDAPKSDKSSRTDRSKSASGRTVEKDDREDPEKAVLAGLLVRTQEKSAHGSIRERGVTAGESGPAAAEASGKNPANAGTRLKKGPDAGKTETDSRNVKDLSGRDDRIAMTLKPETVSAEILPVNADSREISPASAGKSSRRENFEKNARAVEVSGVLSVKPSADDAARIAAVSAHPFASAEIEKKTGTRPTRIEGIEVRKKAPASGDAKKNPEEVEGVKPDILDGRTESAETPLKKAGAGENADGFPGNPGTDASGASSDVSKASPEGQAKSSSFQSVFQRQSEALQQYLQSEGNEGIVRNARIVLRDGDRGEIRLRLKPEHLGTVRISLSMNEDHIAGKIIVENETVREAFEKNLQSLVEVFSAEGLQTGNLEVAVGNERREGGERQEPGRAHSTAVKEIERHTAPAEYSHDGYLNLIV